MQLPRLSSRAVCRFVQHLSVCPQTYRPLCSSSVNWKKDDQQNMPVRFSQSPAFKFRPDLSYGGLPPEPEKRLWFQPYVVVFSLFVFMVYFFVAREENDIDERLGSLSVEQQLHRYEVNELRTAIKHCKARGIDTSEMEDHLYELLMDEDRKAGK